MKWNKFHLDTAKNLPLYQLLADQLRQKILTGVLAPGESSPVRGNFRNCSGSAPSPSREDSIFWCRKTFSAAVPAVAHSLPMSFR